MNFIAIRSTVLLLLGLAGVMFLAQPHPLLGAICLLLLLTLIGTFAASVPDWLKQGDDHAANGNFRKAIAAYNRALRQQPDSAVAYYSRGVAHLANGNQATALADFNRALQLDPNFAQAYAERGILYLEQGNHQQAFDDCDRAIQLDLKYERAYFGRGAALLSLGNAEGAIADFSVQIHFQPTAAAYYNLGVLLFATGKPQLAIQCLTEALRLDAKFVSALYNRGNAHYDCGNEAGAFADYQQAKQLEQQIPAKYLEDEHGFYGRGLARSRMGDRTGAIADLEHAAQICQKHQNTSLYQMVIGTLKDIQKDIQKD